MGQTMKKAYNHSPFQGFAEALLNTYEVARPKPETLTTPADIDLFLIDQGLPSPLASDVDLVDVCVLREGIRPLFGSDTAGVKCATLNAYLQLMPVTLALGREADEFQIGFTIPGGASVLQTVRMAAGIDLAVSTDRFGYERFRTCEAPPCQDVFTDTSRKGARRFCSSRCASRVHVADFRQRIRT